MNIFSQAKGAAMVPILLCTLVLSGGAATAQQAIDETIRTSATGIVRINNIAGDVQVEGWSRNEISVTGTLGRGTERLAITGDAANTEIRVILPRNGRNIQGTSLLVRVPVGKNVDVHTTSADISLSNVIGTLGLMSTSGDIEVSGTPRNVSAQSTSGDVEIEGSIPGNVGAHSTSGDVRIDGAVRGRVKAESVSGDVEIDANTPEITAKSVSGSVRLTGVSGRITATTVSGDTEVEAQRVSYGSFESVSGDINYAADLEPGATLMLKSHSGEIEILLPSNVSADFRASSFSGSIDNEFGPEARRTSRYGPGRELRFSTGGGGTVVLESFSGAINIRRR